MNQSPASFVSRVGLVALALASVPSLALAVLQDHGPVTPATGYPAWYRDSTGTPLELCLDQTTPSPNASAGGAPMCFPWAANPAGFAGNFGDEQFYAVADSALDGPAFSARLVTALEAAYANGTPAKGDEIVFARVRIVMDVTVPGTYRVIHPYGSKTFDDVEPGNRAVFDTSDIGVGAGLFEGAMGGAVGPFLRWDVLDLDPASGVPYTLTVDGPNGPQEYLGDPSIAHTVTGSPFGTNFFRVEGPAGSDLDGQGNDFIETPLFTVVGRKYMRPIAQRLAVERATYTNDGTNLQVDVFAKSVPTARLVAQAPGMPSLPMIPDGFGNFFAHVVYPLAGTTPPASVTVTNLSDVPVSAVTAPVTDIVTLWSAAYDTTTGILDVAAFSSDSIAAPALDALGVGAGLMSPSAGNPSLRTLAVVMDAPPPEVTVVSAAGGVARSITRVSASAPVDPSLLPVAVPDAVSTLEDTPASFPVLANDVPSLASVILVANPTSGAATVNPTTGAIDYTPRANYTGPDSISYMIQDGNGFYSNAANVTIDVVPVNDAPVTGRDSIAVVRFGTAAVDVVANDVDPDGTVVAGSVAIVGAPTKGTATVANGVITYVSSGAAVGADLITYTVQDDTGAVATGTVNVTIFSTAETITMKTALYNRAQKKWTVDGSTSFFGVNVQNSVSIYNGTTTAAPLLASGVPVDATGTFTWVPVPGSVAAPNSLNRILIVTQWGKQFIATVTLK